MNEAIAAVRHVQIVAGLLAFVVAPVALLLVREASHPRWGKLSLWATAVVAVAAIVLVVWRPTVFSFCSAVASYLALYRKRPHDSETVTARDWRAAIVMLAGGAMVFALGLSRPTATWTRMSAIAIVLGLFGIAVAAADFLRFTQAPRRAYRAGWWARARRTVSSYAALVSASWAVIFTFLPLTSRYFSPSVVGISVFVVWFAYYRARFSRRAVVAVAP